MINKDTYKRLTAKKEDRYWEQDEFWQSAQEPSYEEIEELYSRLSELEDKIENGKLVFIDEPFWSEYHDCWAVFQRTEDIVQTCYMTVNQAKDYKNRKDVGGDKE